MEINGKEYPLWSQFVDKQDEFIGKSLQDFDCGMESETVVTGVELKPNGDDSAMFIINGKDFDCGFDVKHGGISGRQDDGWLTFSGYGGHRFRIATTD